VNIYLFVMANSEFPPIRNVW